MPKAFDFPPPSFLLSIVLSKNNVENILKPNPPSPQFPKNGCKKFVTGRIRRKITKRIFVDTKTLIKEYFKINNKIIKITVDKKACKYLNIHSFHFSSFTFNFIIFLVAWFSVQFQMYGQISLQLESFSTIWTNKWPFG